LTFRPHVLQVTQVLREYNLVRNARTNSVQIQFFIYLKPIHYEQKISRNY